MKKEFYKKSKGIYLLTTAAAYLLSTMTLAEKSNPLAAAFIGSLSGTGCFTAFFGAAIGFLTNLGFREAVTALIASAAVCIVRFFLCRTKSAASSVAISIFDGATVFLTNMLTVEKPSEIFFGAALAVISGISCYAFIRFYEQIKNGPELTLTKSSRLTAYSIAAVFLIASATSLSFGILNFGCIICAVAVMISVYRFRLIGGAAVGVICGLGISIANSELSGYALSLSSAALVSSAFSHKGKLSIAASFIFTCAAALAFLGMDKGALTFIADMTIGMIIFTVLPLKELLGIIGRSKKHKNAEGAPVEIFAGRLELMGSTMGELRYALEKTAEALEKDTGDITDVYNLACDKVCKDCRFNMKCWGEEYNDSMRLMNGFLRNLRSGENITPDHFKGSLSMRCQRKQAISDAINKRYEDFTCAGQMRRRIKEMRGILTGQLENTEKMFYSISQEFEKTTADDPDAALKAETVLKRCGVIAPKAAVKISDGSMTLEAYGDGDIECSAEELGDLLIEALGREFDLPSIIKFRNKVKISAFERAEYGIKSAVCQLSRKIGGTNGDCVTGCVDGSGYYYSIVSDGMGSGTRARIDSAFACGLITKFIESGISIESAIELLNTSLMVKSSDESFATLDICKVDLYTGKTTIYKAGGADSFIKSGKTITKIHSQSLPVGVSSALSISSHTFTVGENDVIIMTSDGAELSQKWLEQTFLKPTGNDIDELVKTAANAARFNCEKGKEDDISIVALQIKR